MNNEGYRWRCQQYENATNLAVSVQDAPFDNNKARTIYFLDFTINKAKKIRDEGKR